MARRAVVGIATLILGALGAPHAAAQSTDGPYTQAQAERGRALYMNACASCHGRGLDDGTAPPLVGEDFARGWQRPGMSLDDLFYIIRTTMPEGDLDAMSDAERLDVLAFMLEQNGYAAGERPLVAESEVLSSIPVESRGTSTASARGAPVFVRGPRGIEPRGSGPTQAELDAAESNARDWLYHNHDYAGTRYVGADGIDRDNVHSLGAACVFQMGASGPFQSGPVVYDGVMYVTTILSTVALDAATCRPLWRHEWDPPVQAFGLNNRGVAIKDGRVVRTTSDGYLVALDAADGELLWARQVANPAIGETFTMPPFIYDDLIVVGPAVSEFAIEGWTGAFRLDNGEPVWRFNNVPGAKDGTGTWPNPEGIVLGGGGLWTPVSMDREREELYVAVTNPAPDFPAHLRPGLNLYTNSIVALDVRTGELRWYDQLVPNDSHDWDVSQVSPLITTTVGVEERDLVVTAGKDGWMRVLDRVSRERVYETAIARIENQDVPPPVEGVHACPGVNGGVLWNGPAYSPESNLLYIGAIDWCATYAVAEEVRYVPGQMFMGGTVRPDPVMSGRVSAVDASDGTVRWVHTTERPMLGAVTATSGGLVFVGELAGDLVALDAETGEELYRSYTGGPIGGGVVSYQVDGRQYVAVTSGDPSILNWQLGHAGSPTVLVYTLPE
jgi:alcohol dehydrogenase (cytochrome c)